MEMESVTYQCPNCNAALEYSVLNNGFKCLYCDSEFSEEEIKKHFAENEQHKLEQADPELNEEQKEIEEFTGASALYSCPNCGAGVICGELEASVRCHFCHTPVILTGRLSGEFKPDLIIPFATTKDLAKQAFNEYTKGKFLLPNGFKKNMEIVDISALYVPYWLKSGIVNARANATCKKIRSWRSGDTRYTNTKIYNVTRAAEFAFIRVPCDGSVRIDDQLMESIEPFNYQGIKPFSMSYLSGCAAEKYDVVLEDAAKRIDQRITEASKEELKKDMVGYNSVSITSCETNYNQNTAVYALLPVWFLNYRYNGKDYPFVMNGQTGNRFGILPVSKVKSFFFGAAIFAGVSIAGLLLGGMLFV